MQQMISLFIMSLYDSEASQRTKTLSLNLISQFISNASWAFRFDTFTAVAAFFPAIHDSYSTNERALVELARI
jgi:hypothetical protein